MINAEHLTKQHRTIVTEGSGGPGKPRRSGNRSGRVSDLARWSDEADEAISGDITAAAAYLTPAGRAVVTAVAPGFGNRQRDAGLVGFTTSLGFGRKLDRILRDPRAALAYHAREHGFSASPAFVLAQGQASVDTRPSRERLEALVPRAEQFYGEGKRGAFWDRVLHEYYYERVVVDTTLERIVTWPNLSASGDPQVSGTAWPGPARSSRSRRAPARAWMWTGPPGGSAGSRTGYWPTAAATGSRSWSP